MATQVLAICSTPVVIVLLGRIRAADTAPYARRVWLVGLGLQARGGEVRAHDRRGGQPPKQASWDKSQSTICYSE